MNTSSDETIEGRIASARLVVEALAPTSWVSFSAQAAPLAGYWHEPAGVLMPASPLLDADEGYAIQTDAGRRRAPLWYGAVVHHVAHATHSLTSPGEPWRHGVVARVLDEVHVEAAHVRERPADAKYLCAYALRATLPPANASPPVLSLYATLVLGRVEAGVFPRELVKDMRSELVRRLGKAKVDGIHGMCQDAITATKASALDELRLSYVRRFGKPAWPREFGVCSYPVGADAESPGEFEDPNCPDVPQPLLDVIAQLGQEPLEEVLEENVDELRDRHRQQSAARVHAKRRERRKAQQRAQREKRKSAQDVVEAAKARAAEEDAAEGDASGDGGPVPEMPGKDKTGAGSDHDAATGLFSTPTDADRRLARNLAKALKKAQTRDRARERVRTQMPPGRLNGRELLLREVQLGNRQTVTARPFDSIRTRRSPEPPLTCALMMDTSGSMAWAEEITGLFAWAMARATHALDARFVSVTFGGTPRLMSAPGAPPAKIRAYRASGGAERFRAGFELVDGMLRLESSPGARVLIVVSDRAFMPGEMRATDEIVPALVRAGVVVLWVNNAPCEPDGAIFVDALPLWQLPAKLEDALVEAVRKA